MPRNTNWHARVRICCEPTVFSLWKSVMYGGPRNMIIRTARSATTPATPTSRLGNSPLRKLLVLRIAEEYAWPTSYVLPSVSSAAPSYLNKVRSDFPLDYTSQNVAHLVAWTSARQLSAMLFRASGTRLHNPKTSSHKGTRNLHAKSC